jgi:integrase
MASITKRTSKDGSTSYRVEVRLKGTPPQRATFTRLTDARKWASSTESAIRERRHFKTAESTRHTVADLVDRYTRDVLPTKKPKTQEPQRGQLAWWKAELGAYTLADCTPALIAEARDKLAREPIPQPKRKPSPEYAREFKDGRQREALPAREPRYRGPASINRYLAVLSHAFTVAVQEWAWVEDNPVLKVTKPTEPRGRVRFLADEERDRLLSACRESSNPWLFRAVVVALSTGMRKGELMGLEWKDVDLQAGRITLHETKNGETRVVPLAGPALALLREHGKVRRMDTPLLFPGSRKGSPIDLRTPWETALKRAGIEDFHWHDLRHSTASYLAMNGASLAEIAEVLGHKTLGMVKRYAHLSEAHTADVVARMNARFLGGAE